MKKIYALLFVLIFAGLAEAQTTAERRPARKTITNAELEKYRLQRQQSDPDDEAERARKGLPPRAEEARQRENRYKELAETSRKLREKEDEIKQFWNTQADSLRGEFAAIDAEIAYLERVLNRFPASQTYYAINYVPGVYGFGNFYPPFLPYGEQRQTRPDVYAPNAARQNSSARAGVVFRNSASVNNRRHGGWNGNYSGNGILVVPYTIPTQQDVTRENLRERLIGLRQTRVGMTARWETIVEQARQNGVVIN